MNNADARAFLEGYFLSENAKVSKLAAEELHKRAEDYERQRLETQAQKLLAENPVPPPNKGPSAEQIRAYITEVLDPQLGISPPERL